MSKVEPLHKTQGESDSELELDLDKFLIDPKTYKAFHRADRWGVNWLSTNDGEMTLALSLEFDDGDRVAINIDNAQAREIGLWLVKEVLRAEFTAMESPAGLEIRAMLDDFDRLAQTRKLIEGLKQAEATARETVREEFRENTLRLARAAASNNKGFQQLEYRALLPWLEELKRGE